MNSAVKLVGITHPKIEGVNTTEEFIAYVARVSNPSNQSNSMTASKLLKYLITNKHWSPFEMASMVVEINTTRDIARQVLRHRSFSFQEFCVAGDTAVSLGIKSSGKKVRMRIDDMYTAFIEGNLVDKYSIRAYDDSSRKISYFGINEVFKTGDKLVYKVTLDNGKEIKSTLEHKFLIKDGWKTLSDLRPGDFIAHNGQPIYQDKEWLNSAKLRNIENKKGVQGIADDAECSYHTIRKWLKIHGLSFSKKEVASYTTVWNKGLDKELQPMYGKAHSLETRTKMSESARKGEDSNLYSTGNFSRDTLTFRRRVAQAARGSLKTLQIRQNYKCAICSRDISEADDINLGVEVDHIKPVSLYPESAFDEDNLQAICLYPCHSEKTTLESHKAAETVLYSKIISIEEVGIESTYDIEVDNVSHNYIANGIVTHNSQRYAKATDLGFTTREARLQDTKNRQNSIELSELSEDSNIAKEWEKIQKQILGNIEGYYKWALDNGIAKEQARAVLPEGMTKSRMYMAGSIRSWIHYCEIRADNATQKEHREIAVLCKELLMKELPSLSEVL